MKKFTAIALFLLGLFEIAVGLMVAPIRIYAAEPVLAKKIGVSTLSSEQQRIYHDYMVQFEHQWFLVAGFGVLTVAASIILGRRDKTHERPAA